MTTRRPLTWIVFRRTRFPLWTLAIGPLVIRWWRGEWPEIKWMWNRWRYTR